MMEYRLNSILAVSIEFEGSITAAEAKAEPNMKSFLLMFIKLNLMNKKYKDWI